MSSIYFLPPASPTNICPRIILKLARHYTLWLKSEHEWFKQKLQQHPDEINVIIQNII